MKELVQEPSQQSDPPISAMDAIAAAPDLDPEQGPHAGDLALSRDCLAGRASALQRFDRDFLAAVAGSVRRRGLSPEDTDEVVQELRARLLTGEHPRLMEYSGRGPLRGWLRVVAVRLALNYRRRQKPEPPRELALAALAPDDPELDVLMSRYGAELKRALQAGLASLAVRDRAILRLHLLDGASLSEIGRLYGVNKSSVSRWLVEARAQLLVFVRSALTERITAGDLISLVRVLGARLDLSLTRVMAEDGPP